MDSGRITNHESRIIGVALLILVAIAHPGCGPRTEIQKAGLDQDIARDVNWELRKESRFADINAFCAEGVVTLQGRVDSKAAEEDALRVAQARSRAARVVSKLEIRPR